LESAVQQDFWKSTALRVEKDSFEGKKAAFFHLQSGTSLFEEKSM